MIEYFMIKTLTITPLNPLRPFSGVVDSKTVHFKIKK